MARPMSRDIDVAVLGGPIVCGPPGNCSPLKPAAVSAELECGSADLRGAVTCADHAALPHLQSHAREGSMQGWAHLGQAVLPRHLHKVSFPQHLRAVSSTLAPTRAAALLALQLSCRRCDSDSGLAAAVVLPSGLTTCTAACRSLWCASSAPAHAPAASTSATAR